MKPEIIEDIKWEFIHSEISLKLYKIYLILNGYSNNTIAQYISAINGIISEEHINLNEFVKNIDSVICDYDCNGKKSYLGEKGHNTWINSLNRFKEFLDFRSKLISENQISK